MNGSLISNLTPIILTYNEAPNIARTLAKLRWAKRVVVLDSHSYDDTALIASKFTNVSFYQRAFDTHADQWNYALTETEIDTEWVLALDADYFLTDGLIDELSEMGLESRFDGYQSKFKYCVFGLPLSGSLYPPVVTLFKKASGYYINDGHTQRLMIEGEIGGLSEFIFHDDRKSLEVWLVAQNKYMALEAEHISSMRWVDLDSADKVRKLLFLAPLLAFIYCLTVKGGVLDGRRGIYYALQRLIAELILSLKLMEKHLVKADL
jgi:glycosyltransferase involved in cell wall biosynthesis